MKDWRSSVFNYWYSSVFGQWFSSVFKHWFSSVFNGMCKVLVSLNKDEAPSTARKELPVVWPLKGFYTFSLHVKGQKYGEEREEKAKGILCNIREALHNLLATACMQIY
jgi:hypothetical protein